MTQTPQKQKEASHCSCSHSEGDLQKTPDDLDPNADVQQRAMLRYERQLQSDPQLQVQSKPHETQTCQQSAMYVPALGINPGACIGSTDCSASHTFPSHALTCIHEVHPGLCMYSDPAEAANHASILLH